MTWIHPQCLQALYLNMWGHGLVIQIVDLMGPNIDENDSKGNPDWEIVASLCLAFFLWFVPAKRFLWQLTKNREIFKDIYPLQLPSY